MNTASPSQLPCQPWQPGVAQGGRLSRLLRKVVSIIREMNDASRRLAIHRSSYDLYLPRPNAAPDTYEEFLLRSHGPKLCEPSARARARGRKVR